MEFTHDKMRERLLIQAGVIDPERDRVVPMEPFCLADVRKLQWSPEFERLMRNRLLIGYFRYGCLETQRIHEGNGYDNVSSAIKRLNEFQKTGNTEHLVDAANLCLVEFEVGSHPKKHFNSTDDGIHVER